MTYSNHLLKFMTAFALMFFIVANCEGIYGKAKPGRDSQVMKSLTVNMKVYDIEKTINYYERVLGFERVYCHSDSIPNGLTLMKNGDVIVTFQTMENLAENKIEYGYTSTEGYPSFFVWVDGLQRLYDHVNNLGAEIVKTPYETDYGTRECVIRDCNGYQLVFVEELLYP